MMVRYVMIVQLVNALKKLVGFDFEIRRGSVAKSHTINTGSRATVGKRCISTKPAETKIGSFTTH